MKLQLALDDVTLLESLQITEKIQEYIDIIEIGTPLVMLEGMQAIKKVKSHFPTKEILADLKIMDSGSLLANMAFEAGADYITVLGVTDIITIQKVKKVADERDKEIVVDMIRVEDLSKKVKEMENFKINYIAVHTGADQQQIGRHPIDDMKIISENVTNAKIAVAGGINSDTLESYTLYQPDIVIVGTGITHADNPEVEAKAIKEALIRFY